MTTNVHVVTGATSGIGRAIASAIAATSNLVVAIGRNRSELNALEARFPGVVSAKELDLLDDDAVAQFALDLDHAGLGLRALVHCAGIYFSGSLAGGKVDALDGMYRSNVRAPYLLTQRLIPALERGRGYLIFINSSAGLAASSGAAAYSAMQHAHRALAECWRQELNALGVRVLSIFPGRTNTPRIEALFALEKRSFRPELLLQPDDIAAFVAFAIGLPETVEVTDISVRPAIKSY